LAGSETSMHEAATADKQIQVNNRSMAGITFVTLKTSYLSLKSVRNK